MGKETFRIHCQLHITSKALFFFFVYLFGFCISVFEVGKRKEESKILVLSGIDALVLFLPHLFNFYWKKRKKASEKFS